MLKYKDTLVAKNSELALILADTKDPLREKKAKQCYDKAHQFFHWPADKKHLLNWRIGDARN
jgi:hypothetical protein